MSSNDEQKEPEEGSQSLVPANMSMPPPPPPFPPPPPSNNSTSLPPGMNFMSYFGFPMMSGPTASTPTVQGGNNTATVTTSPLMAQQFLHYQHHEQQQAPLAAFTQQPHHHSSKVPHVRGKKKRGRPKKRGGVSRDKSSSSLGRPTTKRTSDTGRSSRLTIQDDDPKRFTNPLLALPYADGIPQASDLLIYPSLAFCKPDTFSVAYHAKLLGIHYSQQQQQQSERDVAYNVPSLGTWHAQTCGGQHDESAPLLYVDPLYDKLLQLSNVPLMVSNTSIAGLTRHVQQSVLSEVDEGFTHVTCTTNEHGRFVVQVGSIEIDYDFAWFPLQPNVSELVLQIHSVKTPQEEDRHDKEVLVAVCLVLQHARESHVWYGLWLHVSRELTNFLQTYFGMTMIQEHVETHPDVNPTKLITAMAKSLYSAAATLSPTIKTIPPQDDTTVATTTVETLESTNQFWSNATVSLICDLHQSSTRYSYLLFQQQQQQQGQQEKAPSPPTTRERMLVRLPTLEQVQGSSLLWKPATRIVKQNNNNNKSLVSSAKEACRNIAFGVRVTLSNQEEESSQLQLLNANGQVMDGTVTPSSTAPSMFVNTDTTAASSKLMANSLQVAQAVGASVASLPVTAVTTTTTTTTPVQPSWDVVKVFTQVISTSSTEREEDDEILSDLRAKQAELKALEDSLKPKAESMLQQVIDIRMEYEKGAAKRQEEQEMLQSYNKILGRRKEIDTAWQKQLEQDMDAVCEICRDGEVTPDNQILFCEACNVAVHQMCYGIEEVPEGDYYCVACRYLSRDKMSKALLQRGGDVVKRVAPSPLPICCELCPRKQGAFVRSDTSSLETKNPDGTVNTVLSKWVHVVCAKWQGLNFVPPSQTDVVEDVQELKKDFLRHGKSCILCLGRRGAYVNCRQEGCDSWMHVTCARATGLCEVSHGENCHGDVESNPWTLLCPEHSTIDPKSVQDCVSIEQLVRSAEEFPPEPYVEPIKVRPNKVFNKMTGTERRKFLADPQYERDLLEELSKKLHGVHCEVCHQFEEDGRNLKKCAGCSVVFCSSCLLPVDIDPDEREYRCPACKYIEEMEKTGEEYEQPQCTMCFQRGGWLREAYAEPINRKTYWRQHPEEYETTLFAKDLWCHVLCTMWHPKVTANKDGVVDCSSIIMTNGHGHIMGNVRCALCGDNRRMKVSCSEEGCRGWGLKRGPFSFHVTCAREAGLEVNDKPYEDGQYFFDVKCFRHGGNDFAFRARMEDLIELERRRAGKCFEKEDNVMSLAHASRLYNKAIVVMQMLGWAWRWAEWWVAFGDNWEPLLEPGEREEDMTKEELKIVYTTPESRCQAARKCRLAALGAALRNRDYDKDEGDDTVALNRALRAVLHTPELVGPLEQYEIDFFAEWLARVYRSKSRLLGFGEDKIPVQDHVRNLHVDDKSPKYVLGSRRLPGKQELPEGQVFETDFHDVDDFLKPEMFEDGSLVTPESLKSNKRGRRGGRKEESPSNRPRGKRSKLHSRSDSIDAAAAVASETEASPGTTVILKAVYTAAPAEANDENTAEYTESILQLLPSPVEAVVVDADSRKRKLSSELVGEPPLKRRGWKPKPIVVEEPNESVMESSSDEEIILSDEEIIPAPKRRGQPSKKQGRPPKANTDLEMSPAEDVVSLPRKRGPGRKPESGTAGEQVSAAGSKPPAKKRIGRPPKQPVEPQVADNKLLAKKRIGRPPKQPLECQVAESKPPAKERIGRPPKQPVEPKVADNKPPAKKRIGRPPKQPLECQVADSKPPAKKCIGQPPQQPVESAKRIGRPPKYSPGDAVPSPKRRGRPPTANNSDTQPSSDPFAADALLAKSIAANEQDLIVGNIAERIKRRRSSPKNNDTKRNDSLLAGTGAADGNAATVDGEAQEGSPVEEQAVIVDETTGTEMSLNEEPPPALATMVVVDEPAVEERTTYSAAKQVQKEASADFISQLVTRNEGSSDDDDIPVAEMVLKRKQAQGEPMSVLIQGVKPEESSDSSSAGDDEAPLTPRQRGRRQGKRNAVRDIWGR